MALATNALTTYAAIGNREDITDDVYRIDPTDTPYISDIGRKEKAKAVYHEWQKISLNAATADNAVLEGDDVTPEAARTTERIGNYCQILRKSVAITETQEEVDTAGRASEMAFQKALMGLEMRNDLQLSAMANQGYVSGDAGTARRMRGLESWLESNVSYGTGGANSTAATAAAAQATAGAQRPFTEDLLKAVIKVGRRNGMKMRNMYVGPHNKGVVSGFEGRTQARQQIAADQIQAAAHVYVSEYGPIKVKDNVHQQERCAFLVDPAYATMAYLRPIRYSDLAKTGDSDRGFIRTEVTHVVRNEAAHAKVADLTTS